MKKQTVVGASRTIAGALEDAGVNSRQFQKDVASISSKGKGIYELFRSTALDRKVMINPLKKGPDNKPIMVPSQDGRRQVPELDMSKQVEVRIFKISNSPSASIMVLIGGKWAEIGYVLFNQDRMSPWSPIDWTNTRALCTFRSVFQNRNGMKLHIPETVGLSYGDCNQIANPIVSEMMAEIRSQKYGQRMIAGTILDMASFIGAEIKSLHSIPSLAGMGADDLKIVYLKEGGQEMGAVYTVANSTTPEQVSKEGFKVPRLKQLGEMGLRRSRNTLITGWTETDIESPRLPMIGLSIEIVRPYVSEEVITESQNYVRTEYQHSEHAE